MLPALEVCQEQIKTFKNKHPCSTFDEFWEYKRAIEEEGSNILDEDHLSQTARSLGKILRNPKWGMTRTGIASDQRIEQILASIRPYYGKFRCFKLGHGGIRGIREELTATYKGLCGITNVRQDDPDPFGEFLITGKSKILMFIWGQTPGFDDRVRENFSLWTHAPAPYQLHHLWVENRRYTPEQFCDIIEELDHWVQKWPNSNGGVPFQSLYPDEPVGRIIDMIYWI